MAPERQPPTSQEIKKYQEVYASRLDRMFELYKTHHIDARLIGSLGRLAAVGQTPTNFKDEYGYPKDVDIIILPRQGQNPDLMQRVTNEATKSMYPIALDEHYKGQIIPTEQGTQIRYKQLVKDVDTCVFEPKDTLFLDVPIRTFDPNTLFHLTILHGPLRPKDAYNVAQLLRAMPETSTIVPEALFEPFDELSTEIEKTYRKDVLLGRLRWEYHTKTPVPVRRALSTITEPIWHKLR